MKFTLFFFRTKGRLDLFPSHEKLYPLTASHKDEIFYLLGCLGDLPHSVTDNLGQSGFFPCFVSVLDGQSGERGYHPPQDMSGRCKRELGGG